MDCKNRFAQVPLHATGDLQLFVVGLSCHSQVVAKNTFFDLGRLELSS